MPELEALAAHASAYLEGRRGTRRGRLRGPGGRHARHLPTLSPSTQQADDDGGGGDGDPRDAAWRRGCAASATRDAPSTWARSITVGFASTIGSRISPRRSASPRSRGSTRCCARDRVAALYADRLAGGRRSGGPFAARGERAAQLVRLYRPSRPGPRSRRDDRTLAERDVASKAYLPASTSSRTCASSAIARACPVAEAAAADSLALPFFRRCGEGEVDRVCPELATAVGHGPIRE